MGDCFVMTAGAAHHPSKEQHKVRMQAGHPRVERELKKMTTQHPAAPFLR